MRKVRSSCCARVCAPGVLRDDGWEPASYPRAVDGRALGQNLIVAHAMEVARQATDELVNIAQRPLFVLH
jgi:hypothetical protein